MTKHALSFPEGKASQRLDKFLSESPDILSRTLAQKMIVDGLVRVNGKSATLNKLILSKGDRVEFEVPEEPKTELEAVTRPLEIHFEDNHLLVVYKEEGVVVHPSAGHENDTLVNYLLAHTQIEAEPGHQRPGIVHRLDKDTSGLLVVAKTERALRKLAENFAEHSILRVYDAIVIGVLKAAVGKVEKKIGRSSSNRKKQAVRQDGREAITHWKKIQTWKGFSHIRCTLETGRTHQIRVHLSSIGHPVVGDPIYGGGGLCLRHSGSLETLGKMGMALHARRLGFRHPENGEWLEFEKKLPPRMENFIAQLDLAEEER